ncbi:MAG: ABC transporter substrate-binding protein, partial [Candidatus Methanoplasma sp.]|nr:ABC transporter substrate-binding protein [Candidatus Methanoplasma sp.]
MMNNKLVAIFAVAVIVVAGAGIAYMLTRDNVSDGNTITDARGRNVTVPEEINSIFAMKACSLQSVSYFDAVNKVTYLDINESFKDTDNRTHSFVLKDLLKDLPRVDSSDAEQVVATGVDIVISSTVDVSKLDDEQNRFGIPVFAINADVEFDSDLLFDQILSLGKLFKEEARAKEVVDGMRAMIKDITNNVGNADGKAYACGMNFFGAAPDPFLRTSGNYLPFEYSKIGNIYEPVIG